jgi:hypothetical protein
MIKLEKENGKRLDEGKKRQGRRE